MSLRTLLRVDAHACEFGGERPSGWLPPGAAVPLPTPVRRLTLDLEIATDGHGFLLLWQAREDASTRGDLFFDGLEEARAEAERGFGVRPDAWGRV